MTACPAELTPAVVAVSVAINTKNITSGAPFDATRMGCPAQDQAAFDKLTQQPIDEIDKKLLCSIMCCCRDNPAVSTNQGRNQYQECVTQTLDSADEAMGGRSRYKAEVSYDMLSEETPRPLMHRDGEGNDTTQRSTRWQTRTKDIDGYARNKGHVRRPDVVIVKDPRLPPYQDNIEKVVEMKFDDRILPEQRDAYEIIAGDPNKFQLIEEKKDCNCIEGDPDPITVPVAEQQRERADDTADGVDWSAVGATVGMGLVTAVSAIATVALLISPFEGPAGEIAAGAGTIAAAGATSAAFSKIFNPTSPKDGI
jgi:hypothetical protein